MLFCRCGKTSLLVRFGFGTCGRLYIKQCVAKFWGLEDFCSCAMCAALVHQEVQVSGGSPWGSGVTGKSCAIDFSMGRISLLRSESDPFENDFVYIRR